MSNDTTTRRNALRAKAKREAFEEMRDRLAELTTLCAELADPGKRLEYLVLQYINGEALSHATNALAFEHNADDADEVESLYPGAKANVEAAKAYSKEIDHVLYGHGVPRVNSVVFDCDNIIHITGPIVEEIMDKLDGVSRNFQGQLLIGSPPMVNKYANGVMTLRIPMRHQTQ